MYHSFRKYSSQSGYLDIECNLKFDGLSGDTDTVMASCERSEQLSLGANPPNYESAADTLHALDKVEKERQDLCTKSGNPVDSDTSQHHG